MPKDRFPKEAISNPKFVQAVRELKKHRMWFNLPSPYQIKIGKFNYFWTTGKITVDGSGKIAQSGIDSFIDLVALKQEPRTMVPIHECNEASAETAPTKDILIIDLVDVAPTDTPPWE